MLTVSSRLMWTVAVTVVTEVLSLLYLVAFAVMVVSGEITFAEAAVPAVLILIMPLFWLFRLLGIAFAGTSAPRQATAKAMVAGNYNAYAGTNYGFRCFVRLRDDSGNVWCQRVIFEPWFLSLGSAEHTVTIHRCPGPRSMFAITFAGRGTLWPAAGASPGLSPVLATLHEFPASQASYSANTQRQYSLALMSGLTAIACAAAPLLVCLYLIVWLAAVWLWAGAAPPGTKWPAPGPAPADPW